MPIFKIILGAAALLVIYKWIIEKSIGFLGMFILIISFLELYVSRYFAYVFGNNLLIYTVISYLSVLFYLIYYAIPNLRTKDRILYVVTFLLWQLFAMWNVIWGEGIENLNISAYNLGMVLTCILVLYWFYNKLYVDSYEALFYNPKLYIGLGILMFYTCSFVVLYFIEYLIIKNAFANAFSDLLVLGNIFLSLGYLGAVLCQIKKPRFITL